MSAFGFGKHRVTIVPGGHGWRVASPSHRVMPVWMRFVVALAALAIVLFSSWQVFWSSVEGTGLTTPVEAAIPQPAVRFRDSVYSTLDQARSYAEAGNWAQAIASIDAASKLIRDARHRGLRVPPDNFEEMAASLDHVQSVRPGKQLLDRLYQARTDLAEYRSSMAPPISASWQRAELVAPRNISTGTHVSPSMFGAPVLDATGLPKEAEFLLPPHSRLFVDNVWVEGLTLVGASQTLDGMHWKDVTFAGARIRYEGGEVELKNVRFVNCTFGFISDDRGARLADAIAHGPVSMVIE